MTQLNLHLSCREKVTNVARKFTRRVSRNLLDLVFQFNLQGRSLFKAKTFVSLIGMKNRDIEKDF
jgi:hypothetical protein